MHKITLNSDSAIAIPPEMLDELNIHSGDAVEFFTNDKTIIIKKKQ